MSSSVRLVGRGGMLAIAVAVAVILSGGDVFAAHTLSHSGTTGHYVFQDTNSHPGAKCFYEGAAGHWEFNHMRVTPPNVFWPNSSAFDSGSVAIKVKLQHWDGSVWTTVSKSTQTVATATKTSPARFPYKIVTWAPPHNHKYRALVRIRWLTPDADVIGQAVVALDHYRIGYDGSVDSACRAEVPIGP
jgi:hypothetical protein